MRVNLINYEQDFNDGILSKFANKLDEGLKKLGVDSFISKLPEKADVAHHINYLPYKEGNSQSKINTLMVTHIWEGYKLDALKVGMETADAGIVMSKDTQDQLVKWGLPKKKLPIILPAHDGLPRRHQVVAILTNVYPDGCKRAEMLTDLAPTLDNNGWAFRIMGSGWVEILTPLVLKGLNVDYFPEFNPEVHKQILDSSDYALYFGNDEGSMAILDAKQAGLKLIATNQGFHKEIGIDHPFETQKQLNDTFKKLSENPVRDWTWEKYAKEHLDLWQKLVK